MRRVAFKSVEILTLWLWMVTDLQLISILRHLSVSFYEVECFCPEESRILIGCKVATQAVRTGL